MGILNSNVTSCVNQVQRFYVTISHSLYVTGAAPYSPGQHDVDMEESEADEPYDPSTPLSQNPTPPLEPQPQPPPPQDTPDEVNILSWLHLIFQPVLCGCRLLHAACVLLFRIAMIRKSLA